MVNRTLSHQGGADFGYDEVHAVTDRVFGCVTRLAQLRDAAPREELPDLDDAIARGLFIGECLYRAKTVPAAKSLEAAAAYAAAVEDFLHESDAA